ncbi:MAG: HDOD domain-containing protein [Gammaproteobacteria bacterium]|nr:HDOD domain-containing protein [Gammaproteobacteria bacterium]NNJ92873.1 HDOD domain-containing protein [Gammaproteobacteria bacterium]
MKISADEILIGRQAIFNSSGNVFAYEVRSSLEHNGHASSSALMLNTFVETGFEKVAGPHKAMITIEAQFLIDMVPLPFDAEKVILTLPADTQLTDDLNECLENCHVQGFSFGIENYHFEEKWQPLLNKIDFVKIDITQAAEQLPEQLATLKPFSIQSIAENISTDEQEAYCKAMEFNFFQGENFSQPTLVATRALSENEIIILQLLANLNDPDVTIDSLDNLIQQDPALSYKILRYINSAAIGLRQKIESIKQAVVLLGLKRVKAWATVLAMTSMKTENKDMLVNAVVRAYMCQALVTKSGNSNPDTAFTVGTLSILDVLMRTPMEKILEKLPLSDDISKALLEHSGELGEALECAIAYENLDWDNASFSGCDTDCLNESYLNSSHEGFRAVMGMEV